MIRVFYIYLGTSYICLICSERRQRRSSHQASQNQMVPPPDFFTLFEKIALNEDWSRSRDHTSRDPLCPHQELLPAAGHQLQQSVPLPASDAPPESTMINNLHYKANLFDRFKAMNLKTTRDVLDGANTRANPQPFASNGTTRMCFSFHLKGMCNGRCDRRANHECHSDQLDEKLKEWANVHYKLP